MAAIGKEFGMSGKWHSSIINNAFVYWPSDQGGKLTAETAIARTRQSVDNVSTVIDI